MPKSPLSLNENRNFFDKLSWLCQLYESSLYGAVSGELRLHTVPLVCYSRRGAAGGGREA